MDKPPGHAEELQSPHRGSLAGLVLFSRTSPRGRGESSRPRPAQAVQSPRITSAEGTRGSRDDDLVSVAYSGWAPLMRRLQREPPMIAVRPLPCHCHAAADHAAAPGLGIRRSSQRDAVGL